MMAKNYNLERLVNKRHKVRKEIRALMRDKRYYTDDGLYKRVAALTSLESYLTFIIEELELKVSMMDVDNYIL